MHHLVYVFANHPRLQLEKRQMKVWDWYVLGGRWPNALKRKDGLTGDLFPNKDIDWEAYFKGPTEIELRKAWTHIQANPKEWGSMQYTTWTFDEFAEDARLIAPTAFIAKGRYHEMPFAEAFMPKHPNLEFRRSWHKRFKNVTESTPPNTLVSTWDVHT